MNRALLLVGAISLLSLSACGDDAPKDKDEGPSCDRRSPVAGLALEDVLARGAFPVGEQQVTLVRDGSCFGEEGNEACSRELRTRLFYPATEAGTDGPPLAEGGPFPLVVYSHGFMSSAVENASLLRILASRGYVALAATFPHTSLGSDTVLFDVVNQPGDVSFLIDWALEGEDSPFAGAIDEGRIVTGGLSLGGLTTLLVTYHAELREPRLAAAFAIAPPSAFFTEAFFETTDIPFLLVAGSADAVVPYPQNGIAVFERMRAPAERVTLEDASHLGFTDQGILLGGSAHHPDSIACTTLAGNLPEAGDGSGWDGLADLGDLSIGVDLAADFGTPCDDAELPYAMRPRRQLELLSAAVVSFLEGRLNLDGAYAAFLEEGVSGDGCDAVYASK